MISQSKLLSVLVSEKVGNKQFALFCTWSCYIIGQGVILIMTILKIVKDGNTYRFTDVIKVGDHYLAHQILDDNTIGKMEHRITMEEYNSGLLVEADTIT